MSRCRSLAFRCSFMDRFVHFENGLGDPAMLAQGLSGRVVDRELRAGESRDGVKDGQLTPPIHWIKQPFLFAIDTQLTFEKRISGISCGRSLSFCCHRINQAVLSESRRLPAVDTCASNVLCSLYGPFIHCFSRFLFHRQLSSLTSSIKSCLWRIKYFNTSMSAFA